MWLQTEECFREGTKLLVCVARKSSTARTPEEAEQLLKDIETFRGSAESKQEERVNSISKLVSELFGMDFSYSLILMENRKYRYFFTIVCVWIFFSSFYSDDGEHTRQVNRIVLENNDMLDSFLTVSKELSILEEKLKISPDNVKQVCFNFSSQISAQPSTEIKIKLWYRVTDIQ